MTVRELKSDLKIYVVSLARATERRKAIREQFSRYGIDFVFIEAVDAKQFEPAYLQSQVDQAAALRNLRRPLTGAEIACALSHRLVYRDIVEGGYCGGVVLEDDAILGSNFPVTLEYFRKSGHELRDRMAVFNLETLSRPYSALLLRKRTAVSLGQGVCLAERVPWLSSEAYGACGYYITAGAAESVLSLPRITTVADQWSTWARRVRGKIFVSLPPTIIHPLDNSRSEIRASNREVQSFIEERRKRNVMIHWIVRLLNGPIVRSLRLLLRPVVERIL